MSDFVRDLRIALRRLRRAPSFTLSAILVLALGIGASVAMFSVVEATLIAPWPYHAFDRIVVMRGNFPALGRGDLPVFSAPELADLRQQTEVFEHVWAGNARNVNMMNGSQPERVRGATMTASAFAALGVQPLLGRVFTAADDEPGAAPVVVLSYRFWKNHLGADAQVVGRTLTIEGAAAEVIGVMPPRFVWWDRDLWMPLRLDPATARRDVRNLYVQATLRPGATLAQAEAQLQVFAGRLATDHPEIREYRGWSIRLNSLQHDVLRDARPALLILLGAVVLLLIIGCANVASMMLVRATARRAELAVRAALGASPRQIARHLSAEALLISMAGGALGALAAGAAVPAVASWLPYGYIPAEADVHVDAAALVLAGGVSVAAGLLIGWLPALQMSRADPYSALREGSVASGTAHGRRVRTAFLIGQVALAVVIFSGASLLLKSFERILSTDRGFRVHHVLAADLPLAENRYRGPGEALALYEQILRRAGAIPGAQEAALASSAPVGPQPNDVFVCDAATASGPVQQDADVVAVSPDYFRLLQVPLEQGRAFSAQDGAAARPVAIVNQAMAARLWPGTSAVGRHLAPARAPARQLEVVGVAGDVRGDSLLVPPRPAVYVPWTQAPSLRRMAVLVRTARDSRPVLSALRVEVAAVDPELPLVLPRLLEDELSDLNGPQRLATALLSAFAAMALALSAFGIYASIAQSVEQRRVEIGIRLALGAGRAHVLRVIMADALRVLAAGLLLGGAAAFAASRVLAGLLYQVSPHDPGAFVAMAMVLSAAVLVASYLPARLACRIDPVQSLR